MSDDRYMVGRRTEGATLEEIGKELGITRQAVHQILMKRYGTSKFTSLLNAEQISGITGLTTDTIKEYRKQGIIKQVNTSQSHRLYNFSAVKAIRAFRQCKVCGGCIPVGRQKYCSQGCYDVARFKLWKKCQWRNFRRKKGQPIIASIDYVRNNKVEVKV